MDRFRPLCDPFSGTLLSVDPCPSTQSGFSIVVQSCLVRSVICNRASCILLINEKKMSKRIFQESRRGTYVRFNSKVAKDCIYADAYCVIVTLGIKKSETIFRGNR